MNRISNIRNSYKVDLEKHCMKNNISCLSVEKLLDAEKTKKLLKRNALIQTNIDKEIDNAVDNEN